MTLSQRRSLEKWQKFYNKLKNIPDKYTKDVFLKF
jgi:hypothetical protein